MSDQPHTSRFADYGRPPVQTYPVILETKGWKDYKLLDMGEGQKLERYGRYTIVRPEPQAMGQRRKKPSQWDRADAVFSGDTEEEGPGRWKFAGNVPETWPMAYGPVRYNGRFMSFRHVGVFPEQAAHWDWVNSKIKSALEKQPERPLKVLNLFGYTGLASLLPATDGAQVTHVDASKKAIGYARENQELSGLEDLPIRWICEDASKFVAREVRRGNTYDGIILDPPKYGRGPKGEVWDLYTSLPGMLSDLKQLMAKDALFMILTAYAIRSSFLAIHELMAETLSTQGGQLESGELVIREDDGTRALSTSLFSRWSSA
ncbi:23S rRNA (cytosine1962-C5)-methyltransferase [Roseibium hamelinense]|uniref:23S rRNA (Cytosine1962-C5)-methyltransferase n=1 Tax=Roseibium hamelinense TaxID=150831 RepID=A0A562SHY1_9HYPH|nr:class I SAM-dependent methyltransferase [Roseibium hamelinense]MTI43967.1 class I SAM-dependent rRNA methyltransferase [Roseibium hamelinense]TWI80738.1 23S rRNA (cytosine1962-C5)-methyltransferase [Roseibium hamelinense]